MIAAANDLADRIKAEKFIRFVTEHECHVYAHPLTVKEIPLWVTERLDIRGNEFMETGVLYAVNIASLHFHNPEYLWQ